MHRIHVPSLPWEEQRSPRGTFHSFSRNISVALGGIRNGGTWCGGHPFDVQIRRIPAGAAVCPFHSHLAQWELFVVLAGEATVRAGPDSHAVRVDDVFVHPPGEPHQLIHRSSTDVEVLIVADNPYLDAFYYLDSNKWGLRPPGKYFRMTEVGYFDGEEEPVAGAPPYQASGSPVAPALTPFAERKRNLADLPWEDWGQSPKKNFTAPASSSRSHSEQSGTRPSVSAATRSISNTRVSPPMNAAARFIFTPPSGNFSTSGVAPPACA